MDATPRIAEGRIRRYFYSGAILLIMLTVVSFTVPTYIRVRKDLALKIDQLSESLIHQKKTYLEAIVDEKIRDIEWLRTQLVNQMPALDPEVLDRRFRFKVKEMVHTTELPDDGYIWINEILDFDGGDDYAIRFAHPSQYGTEGEYLSTNSTDIAGNHPYR